MDFNVKHWGEFEKDEGGNDDWTLSFNELEELLLPQPPRPSPPALYQPSQEETASFQILAPEMCRSDPLVLQTIRLLQHQRQLLQLISRAQTYGIDVTSAPPNFPDDPPIERKSAKQHYLNFLPPNVTPFTEGPSKPQKIQIEGSTSRLILRKAVATIFAHAGYTDSTESVLRVMTDVGHDFLTKFTSLLRANTDNMLIKDSCPFHDVVEETLHNMGFNGMASLHSHYKDRVVGYHYRVRQRTLQLHHQYQLLMNHAVATPSILASSLRREPTVIPVVTSIPVVAVASSTSNFNLPTTIQPTNLETNNLHSSSSEDSIPPPPVYHLHIPNSVSAPIVVQASSSASSAFDELQKGSNVKSTSALATLVEAEQNRGYSTISTISQMPASNNDEPQTSQPILFSAVSR